VLEKYPKEVKLVIKHFPLDKHKFARKAATAALAAHRQGKFWEFHARIFHHFKTLNDAKFQEIARELGLDLKKFNEDLQDPAIRNQINFDLRNGRRAGVRGTPTVFVNGKRLQQRRLQGFTRIIEAELSKK
jgi:protein-disulfide isomerase